jgi:hypothetical protein
VLQNSEKNTREKITRGKIKVLFHEATSKCYERKVSRKQRILQEEKSFSVSTSSSFATTSRRRRNRMLIRNHLPLIVVSPAHQTFITAIAFSCQRFLFSKLLSQPRKKDITSSRGCCFIFFATPGRRRNSWPPRINGFSFCEQKALLLYSI